MLLSTYSIPRQHPALMHNQREIDPVWEISFDNLITLDMLGEGNFGIVHRGTLTRQNDSEPETIDVAIKTVKGKFKLDLR